MFLIVLCVSTTIHPNYLGVGVCVMWLDIFHASHTCYILGIKLKLSWGCFEFWEFALFRPLFFQLKSSFNLQYPAFFWFIFQIFVYLILSLVNLIFSFSLLFLLFINFSSLIKRWHHPFGKALSKLLFQA